MWLNEDAAMERLEEGGAARRFNLECDGETIFNLNSLRIYATANEDGLFSSADIEDIVAL